MNMHTNEFTVICWSTDSYKHLADGLREDCERLDYPFHLYHINENYKSIVRAWNNHPKIIKRGIGDFGTVLFLDIECRILKPIPKHWKAPLISVRNPQQKFWIKYNTGTMLADEKCISFIDTWLDIIDRWEMDKLEPNDFIHWPGDICDELAFNAALAACGFKVSTVKLEYIDRTGEAEISRGCWCNEHTIIQHPTIHHWPKENDPFECKKLFWQNYPGNPEEAARIWESNKRLVQTNSWVFDIATKRYGPEEYWNHHPRPWIDDPVHLTSAQR